MSDPSTRRCYGCPRRLPAESMECRQDRRGNPKWYCPACCKRSDAHRPLIAGSMLGGFRILARRPCVAG